MKYYYSNLLSNIGFLMKNFEINLFFMFSTLYGIKERKLALSSDKEIRHKNYGEKIKKTMNYVFNHFLGFHI